MTLSQGERVNDSERVSFATAVGEQKQGFRRHGEKKVYLQTHMRQYRAVIAAMVVSCYTHDAIPLMGKHGA